ncbi:MAG: glycosyltransferase family 2 protein, partial [Paracoccaceae bacterium]
MSCYTVITTMKNEGAFLLEWVAHHKALGFDNILICTNDCADHTRKMALRLQDMGLARHHATKVWAVTSIQRSALKQATRYAEVREADWIYVCDADEFLVVKLGDGSVRALVAAASEGVEVIPVPWRVFGPNGQRDYREGPVTQQFTHARRAPPPGVVSPAYPKSLFRGLENMHRI